MPELGSAYYRIYADVKPFSKAIKKMEKDANDSTASVSKSLRGMDRGMETSTERTHELGSAFEVVKDEATGLLAVYDRSKRAQREQVTETVKHEKSVSRLSSAYTSARVKLTALTGAMRTNKKEHEDLGAGIGRSTKGIFKFNQAMTLMGHIFKVVKFPAIIAGVGYLTAAVSALTAGVVALTSSLGPSVGILGTIPQLAGTAAQALITLKIGFAGVKDAMKDSLKIFKEPGPAAKEFAAQLSGLLPSLAKFRDNVQAAFLPKVMNGIKAMSKNAGVFQKVFVGSGKAVGGVIERLGGFFGSKGFGKDFAALGGSSNKIIAIFGKTLENVARALTDVAIAAQPLTMWLAKLTEKWTMNWRASAQAGRETGKTAAFFEKTRAVLTTLGHILGNLGTALFNIGRASSKLGGEMLHDLEGLTKKWGEWTGSVEGQNSLKKWFAQAKAPLYEFLGLMGDVVEMIFKVGGANAGGLTDLFKQIRSELLPVISELVDSTTKNFGPVLIDTLVQLAKAAATLAGPNGPLTILVKGIGGLARAFNGLIEKVPELKPVIFTLIGLWGAAKGLKLLGAITGLTKLGGALLGLTKIGATIEASGGIAAMIGLSGFAWIAGIVAAGVALYALYKRVDWFHKAVDDTADAVKTGLIAAFQWLKVALPKVGAALVGVGRGIATGFMAAVNGVKAAVNWIKGAVNAVVTEVSKWKLVLGAIKIQWTILTTYFKVAFTVWKTIFTVGFNVITTVAKAWWSVFSAVVKTGVDVITGYLKFAFSAWKAIFTIGFAILKPIVTAAWEGVKQAFTGALTMIKGIVTLIRGVLHGDFKMMWEGVKKIFSGGVQYIIGVLRAATAPMRTAANAIWNGIKSGVTAAWNFIKSATSTGIAAVKGVITGAYGIMKTMGSSLFRKVGDGITAAVGGVKSAFVSAVNAVLGVAESFVNGIIHVINKLPFVPDFGDVHFPRIGGGGGSNNGEPDRGSGVGTGKKTTLPGLRQGGAVTAPMVMMGEEAPQHHEWVIATNPAYRKSNIGYWAQAGADLGVPGFGIGGALKGAFGGIKTLAGGALGSALGAAKSVAGGVLTTGMKALIGLLPGNPFSDYPMKDMASGLLNSAGKKVGGNKGFQKLGKMLDYGTSFGAKGTPYDYGGGHGSLGGVGAKGGFDCSGFVSAILGAGGLLGSPLDTVGLRGALQGGAGEYVTVGVRGGAGKSGHTMMKVNDGGSTAFFESGSGHGARKVGGWSGNFDMYHPQGFAKGGYFGKHSKSVTVKGQRASKSQRGVLGGALALANRMGASYKAKKALIEAIIVESEAGRIDAGDHDSRGILQARVGQHGRLTGKQQIRKFLETGYTGVGGAMKLSRNKKLSSGTIAQKVQGSAFPKRYAERGAEATRIIRAYNAARPKKAKKKSTAKGAPKRLTKSIGDPGTTGYRSVTGTGQGYTALRGDLPSFYSNWYNVARSTSDPRDDVQWMTAYLAYLRASVGSLVDMRKRGDPRFGAAYGTFWDNVTALQSAGANLPGVMAIAGYPGGPPGGALKNAVSGIAQFAISAGLADPRAPELAEGDPGPEPAMPGDSGIRSSDYESWLESKWGQAQMTRDKADDNAVLAKAHAYYDPRADYVQGPDWMKPPGLTADEELLAQRTKDELHNVAMTGYIDRLVGAVLNSPGGGAGAGANIVFQSYVPPSPREAQRLAAYTVGGLGYQGTIPSSTNRISQ